VSKRSAKYENPYILEEVHPVVLTTAQALILSKICQKQEFSEGVIAIAEEYECIVRTHRRLTSAADDVATIDDLEKRVLDLYGVLNKIPARIDAHLWRFNEDMPGLVVSLAKLLSCIQSAKETIPKPKTKTKSAGPKQEAAIRLKNLFERFGVPYVHSIPVSKKLEGGPLWGAGECFKIVLSANKEVLGDETISGYIASAKYPETND